ncbi:helix-turn-helix domain-containing protein [Chryseobacterium sp. ISL-6]|uniref:winged helix-turn-helix transcriptional regulator n=1 Tax=Chryseobacterium sp. ISL-6 TaxID=2819143 RepID=UPI0020363D78|nr:helix-turn-helix domain-containing protein [Chryseobacterium sp. ISL-6]
MPEFFHDKRLYYTPIEFALNHIGGTWKMPILWRLQEKALRFNELKKDIPHITDKMLTSQLRELESKGLVNRKVFPVVPPKVEYSLTEKGEKAIPVIETIMKYGYELIIDEGIEYPPKKKE